MPETRILVVDDEPPILELLRDLLLGDGHSVDTATTVAQAMGCLDQYSYDLVISDWLLPDGDGLFVADAAATMGAKTMLMSGYLAQMSGGRADGHETVMKPFKLVELLNAVRDAIGEIDKPVPT